MDKATWLGLLIGFGGIIFGNIIEGGHTSSLLQLTAAIIVLAGTAGAVMVSNPMKDLNRGFELFKSAFFEKDDETTKDSVSEIIECVKIVKKESVLALEQRLLKIKDPFLVKILRNIIDGIDVQVIRDTFEVEIESEEEELMNAAKIWSDAGGYAPTIGIIGAVLGLIHVMGNLTDTNKLGSGIAVAFVATVYGVSFANLLFLPIGSKLKKKVIQYSKNKKVILEGALLVNSGLSSFIVNQKLQAYMKEPSVVVHE